MATPSAVGAGPGAEEGRRADLRLLTLAALGVVYGDIGTSPLYTLREAFGHAGGLHLSEPAVYGVLSLVFWSLILVVTVKYVILILRADNRGEGGVLALGTLAARAIPERPRLRALVLGLALLGLALFYGDGLITPAISVLSAVEGLETAAPALQPYVMPLAAAVLLALFLFRAAAPPASARCSARSCWSGSPPWPSWAPCRSSAPVGARGPRPALGRGAVRDRGLAGLRGPGCGRAGGHRRRGALCRHGPFRPPADPRRLAGPGPARPGAQLFRPGCAGPARPAALDHPFYRLAPDWLLWPLIGLATMATIIASQAVISGVFSLTRQAVRLGHLSRMTIEHTSATEIGQVYIPRVNWLLMVGVLAAGGRLRLVEQPCRRLRHLGHRRHGDRRGPRRHRRRLRAGAGVRWSPAWSSARCCVIDLAYFAANALKIPSGGWLPLAVAALFLFTVLTWRRGREVLRVRLYGEGQSVKAFLAELDPMLHRAPGTAVFMTGNPHQVPVALLHNLRRNNVVHERVVILTVRVRDEPHVPAAQRVLVEKLGKGFYRVVVSYGFVDDPDVPRALELCRPHGVPIDLELTSYFLSRETLVPSADPS